MTRQQIILHLLRRMLENNVGFGSHWHENTHLPFRNALKLEFMLETKASTYVFEVG